MDAFDRGLYAQFTSAVDGDLPAGAKYDGFLPEMYAGFEEIGKDAQEVSEKAENFLSRDINEGIFSWETDAERKARVLTEIVLKVQSEGTKGLKPEQQAYLFDYIDSKSSDPLEKATLKLQMGFSNADLTDNEYLAFTKRELAAVGPNVELVRGGYVAFHKKRIFEKKMEAKLGPEGYAEYLKGRQCLRAVLDGTLGV